MGDLYLTLLGPPEVRHGDQVLLVAGAVLGQDAFAFLVQKHQRLSTLEAVPKAGEARERDLAEGEVRSVPRRWYWNSSEASLMR